MKRKLRRLQVRLVFFVVLADFLLGFYVLNDKKGKSGSEEDLAETQIADAIGNETALAELVARNGIFELGGKQLPTDPNARREIIAQILSERATEFRDPDTAVLITVRMVPNTTADPLFKIKAEVQDAVRNLGKGSVQFSESLIITGD
ncbi:MAG: hypothetical protein IPK83_20880 [Planctomycetes bacterium]|nr:hypothetical protein [Planctomycetota bacterium]